MFEIILARNQDHSSLELVQKNSNTKSTKEIFHHKIVCDRFCKGCQGNHDKVLFHSTHQIDIERRKKIIHTKMVFTTDTKIKHLNFNIKEGIVHLIILLSFQYWYAIKICIDFSMKMRGRINK